MQAVMTDFSCDNANMGNNGLFAMLPENNLFDGPFDRTQIIRLIKNNHFAVVKLLDEKLHNDEEIFTLLIAHDVRHLLYAGLELKNNEKFMISAIKQNVYAYAFAGFKLRDSYIIAECVVAKCGRLLKFCSEKLRKNKNLALIAVKNDAFALKYVDANLHHDEFIVSAALEKDGMLIDIVPQMFKNSYQFAHIAVTSNGLALQFLNDELRDNDLIVSAAVKNNIEALRFASDRTQRDKFVINIINRFNYDQIKRIEKTVNDEPHCTINYVIDNLFDGIDFDRIYMESDFDYDLLT